MNTSDIDGILRADPHATAIYKGTHSMDGMIEELTSSEADAFYVFNTQPREKSGEHWMALGIRDGRAYYFDSFGRHPGAYPHLALRLRHLFAEIFWNRQPFQSITTTVCGDYCLLYGLLFARGFSLQQYTDWLYSMGTPDTRDHTLRGILLNAYGSQALSSYRNARAGLRGHQRLHVKRMTDLIGNDCAL